MTSTSQETELKFELDAAGLAALRRQSLPAGMSTGAAVARTLLSIYHDTADHRLFQHRISLRLRRSGKNWLQTVKRGTGVSAGLSSPLECEAKVTGPELDLAAITNATLRKQVRTVVGDAPLVAVFETRMRRTTRLLTLASGARVELALDAGEIIAGDRVQPLCEAELELKSGPIDALYEAAALIFPEGCFRFSEHSKAARGFALARGETPEPLAARSGGVAPAEAAMTTQQALADILRGCLAQIVHNRAVAAVSAGPEGPHQLRVALRRLRTALKTFRPVIDCAEMRRLDAEARWLARAVGDLRDLDVLIAEIIAPAACEPPRQEDMATLRALVSRRRDGERGHAVTALCSSRANAFLFDLGRWTETRGWRRKSDRERRKALAAPVAIFAGIALDRLWKRVKKRARHLERLSVEQRHALRRALKRLRYAADYFSQLFPAADTASFIRELKRLQDLFGYLNDVALANRLAELVEGDEADTAAVERAAGYVMGWHAAHADTAWAEVRERWEALKAAPKFWRS